jgi:hypothetical protein
MGLSHHFCLIYVLSDELSMPHRGTVFQAFQGRNWILSCQLFHFQVEGSEWLPYLRPVPLTKAVCDEKASHLQASFLHRHLGV